MHLKCAVESAKNSTDNRYKNVTPLVPRYLRFTVDERIDAEGKVVKKLLEAELLPVIRKIKRARVQSVAVCFMHSYKNQSNEQMAVKYLRKNLPGVFVTASFEVLPSIRFYERVSSTGR